MVHHGLMVVVLVAVDVAALHICHDMYDMDMDYDDYDDG